MLNHLAQTNRIDWDSKDSSNNCLMDCLKSHTNNGTLDEAKKLCRQKCKKLYQNWVKYQNDRPRIA